MKRWLLILLLLLAAWFGLKDRIYQAWLASGPAILPPPLDYSQETAWAAKPDPKPAGAWEYPWGVDAFFVLPPANVPAKHGLLPTENDAVVREKLRALKMLSEAIPGETPVYAPLYRAPSPASQGLTQTQMVPLTEQDISDAFEHYLEHYNQGRGVLLILAGDAQAYTRPLMKRLQDDDLSYRFAGVVRFSAQDVTSSRTQLRCADILNEACDQWVETQGNASLFRFLLPGLKQQPAALSITDAPGVANAIKVQAETVSTWLDETQPKPAEPFFATQIIESAPVFRPGEDTPIASEKDN